MRAEDVIEVLDRLDAAGIVWWLEGGWGVDALLGRQTRDHRDLDVGVHPSDLPAVERALSDFRRIDMHEWPRFLILEDERGRRVDLAITTLGEQPACGRGWIRSREVRCVALSVQLDHARVSDADALRKRFDSA